jgi:hypothetical protein
VEAAADVVVDAAEGHAVEGDAGHLEGLGARGGAVAVEEREEVRVRGELGPAVEAAALAVEGGDALRDGLGDQLGVAAGVGGEAGPGGLLADRVGQLVGGAFDAGAVGLPELGDADGGRDDVLSAEVRARNGRPSGSR